MATIIILSFDMSGIRFTIKTVIRAIPQIKCTIPLLPSPATPRRRRWVLRRRAVVT